MYLARDSAGREVALKELHFAHVPSVRELEAFEREAATLCALRHPAIPRFVSSFQEGTGVGLRLYLASEFVSGRSLGERITANGQLDELEAFRLARETLEVLRYLHGRTPAVIHRDIKPANLMWSEDGRVVLVDFGSVREVAENRTHGSSLVGTFGYMPPEQLGGTVDRTSDLYALAATILHAVSGRAPSEFLQADLSLRLPDSLSPSLRSWLARALMLDPKKRFQTADEAKAALDAPAVSTRPSRLMALLAGLVLAGLGTGVLRMLRHSEPLEKPAETVVGSSWLERVKSRCNNLQALQVIERESPPSAGDGATCLALAGRYTEAQRFIDAYPPETRIAAARQVFEFAHPMAENGQETAAAPMLELVLRYEPDNFRALYRAGLAHYWNGETPIAKERLERFLNLYSVGHDDGFRVKARQVLERIARGQPADESIGHGGSD